jgi:hypothetical protein
VLLFLKVAKVEMAKLSDSDLKLLTKRLESELGKDTLTMFKFQNAGLTIGPAAALPSERIYAEDKASIAVIENVGKTDVPVHLIQWLVKRMHFVYLAVKNDSVSKDNTVLTWAYFLAYSPVFVGRTYKTEKDSAYGSVFWGLERMARLSKDATAAELVVADDLILSIVGIHYFLVKNRHLLGRMAKEMQTGAVAALFDALQEIFYSNLRALAELKTLYRCLLESSLNIHNTTCVLLGIMLDSVSRAETDHTQTVIEYDAVLKTLYRPAWQL